MVSYGIQHFPHVPGQPVTAVAGHLLLDELAEKLLVVQKDAPKR